MYLNRITLAGYLGNSEVRTARNEAQFTVFSLATKRSWKDRETGEYRSETTWHRCLAFSRLGEFAATLTKGAHLMIEGDIRTREYTQKVGGKKPIEVRKSITEVRVTSISKLDRGTKFGFGVSSGQQEVSE
jgi:single-strand DNA-binding protein